MKDYIVLDLEMSGLEAKKDHILEIGAVKVKNGVVVSTFQRIVKQTCEISEIVTNLTGITAKLLETGSDIKEVLPEYLEFEEGLPLVGHNVIFDYSFLKQAAVNQKIAYEKEAVDTLKLSRKLLNEPIKKSLDSLCEYYKIERNEAHRALDDAMATQKLFELLASQFNEKSPEDFRPKLLQYKAKRQTPMTLSQKRYLKELIDYHKIETTISLEEMTRSEASRLTDQWIAQYGRMNKKL